MWHDDLLLCWSVIIARRCKVDLLVILVIVIPPDSAGQDNQVIRQRSNTFVDLSLIHI